MIQSIHSFLTQLLFFPPTISSFSSTYISLHAILSVPATKLLLILFPDARIYPCPPGLNNIYGSTFPLLKKPFLLTLAEKNHSLLNMTQVFSHSIPILISFSLVSWATIALGEKKSYLYLSVRQPQNCSYVSLPIAISASASPLKTSPLYFWKTYKAV